MKVGFIGLGKLGMPCAEVMARHYPVKGYDIAERTSDSVEVVTTLEEAVVGNDLVFVALQTPHDPEYGGEKPTSDLPKRDFDYGYVEEVLSQINEVATKDQLIVLISTVLPGTSRSRFVGRLSNTRFIYNPYLIAMGTVQTDMVFPEMIIIGTEDGSITGDAMKLMEFYRKVTNASRVEVGTWDEAEAVKIFYNTFISAKLSLVNMIQDVAERNGNMSVDVVTGALARSTKRITSSAYMTAGMGDAGPCHPRDNIALSHLAERLDLGYDLFGAIMGSREIQARNMAAAALKHGRDVCIVGKAYKPGVDLIDGSYSLLVGHYIETLGGRVVYYDRNTGDLNLPTDPMTFLIGYWDDWTLDVEFPSGSLIFDPWRRYPETPDMKIIHYGDTRPK